MTAPPIAKEITLAPEFPILDSLRAVGALAVLTTHVAFQAGSYTTHGTWGAILARFDVGVAIFFVLSGFLLSRPHFARHAADFSRPATGRYYWKRFVRIYPVYAVTVVIAFIVVPQGHSIDLLDWLRTVTMTNVYTTDRLPQGLTQMWSLAAEVAFYLILPALMVAALGRRRATLRTMLVLGALVAVTVVWHLWLAPWLDGRVSGQPGNWLPSFLAWFAVGIGFAAAHVRLVASPGRFTAALAALGRSPGVCWTLVAGLMLVAATPIAGPTLLTLGTPAQGLAKSVLYAGVGGLVVLTGVFADPAGHYAQVLSHPAPRHVGHISYSIFCIHLPILTVVWMVTGFPLFRGHGFIVWVLTVIASLVAAELLYRFVELPGMRLKNLGRRTPPADTQPHKAAEATTTA